MYLFLVLFRVDFLEAVVGCFCRLSVRGGETSAPEDQGRGFAVGHPQTEMCP